MTTLPLPSPPRRRWFFLHAASDRLLAASAIFSCLLVAARIYHTGCLTFLFMIWNLFLACLPYGISAVLTRMRAMKARAGFLECAGWKMRVRWMLRITAFCTWLLFIPNSFYLLTDLYHLADGHRNVRVPEWFDLALILSFAWNGLLMGIWSTRQIENLLIPDATWLRRWLLLYPVMWLNALGVYIGRDLRYNSWDIVVRPMGLLSDILALIAHPMRHHFAWGMIFCFSILLTFIYCMLTRQPEPLEQ
jgi:uncharacterized membrane protein